MYQLPFGKKVALHWKACFNQNSRKSAKEVNTPRKLTTTKKDFPLTCNSNSVPNKTWNLCNLLSFFLSKKLDDAQYNFSLTMTRTMRGTSKNKN